MPEFALRSFAHGKDAISKACRHPEHQISAAHLQDRWQDAAPQNAGTWHVGRPAYLPGMSAGRTSKIWITAGIWSRPLGFSQDIRGLPASKAGYLPACRHTAYLQDLDVCRQDIKAHPPRHLISAGRLREAERAYRRIATKGLRPPAELRAAWAMCRRLARPSLQTFILIKELFDQGQSLPNF